jgi:hypothetical protein
MDGRLDKTAICTAPIQLKQLGGSVSLELPFLDGRLNVFAWIQRRRRRITAWQQYVQTQRVLAIHRGGTASRWHANAKRRPGATR